MNYPQSAQVERLMPPTRDGTVAAELNRTDERISAASVALDQLTEILGPILSDSRPTAADLKSPPVNCGLANQIRTQSERVGTLHARIQDLFDRVMLG